MIEIIYRNNESSNGETGSLKLPKNIRQIGNGTSDYQIYIEDYLMSYLKKLPERDGDIRYGVLLGNVKYGNGYTYFFINGAVDVEDVVENTIIFNDDIWTGLYEDINAYFSDNKIVGWFAGLNYSSNNDMMNIQKLHLDNFAGNDKLFLKLDMEEDEENFYVYESMGMTKQPCYHIYFEKSEQMEDYIYGTGKRDLFRTPVVKNLDSGKYGILLNNINEKRVKETIVEERIQEKEQVDSNTGQGGESLLDGKLLEKFNKKINIGKIATAAAFISVIAAAGFMYKDGRLSGLQNDVKSVVSNIISRNEGGKDNIITVNGVISGEKNSEISGELTSDRINKDETSESISSSSNDESQTKEQETTEQTTSEPDTTEKVDEVVAQNKPEYYVVEAGDTITSISVKIYDTKDMVDEIIELNNIKNPDIVLPGDKLLLP